jgi:hypothetical protein
MKGVETPAGRGGLDELVRPWRVPAGLEPGPLVTLVLAERKESDQIELGADGHNHGHNFESMKADLSHPEPPLI